MGAQDGASNRDLSIRGRLSNVRFALVTGRRPLGSRTGFLFDRVQPQTLRTSQRFRAAPKPKRPLSCCGFTIEPPLDADSRSLEFLSITIVERTERRGYAASPVILRAGSIVLRRPRIALRRIFGWRYSDLPRHTLQALLRLVASSQAASIFFRCCTRFGLATTASSDFSITEFSRCLIR
jgi:hypothetical protein